MKLTFVATSLMAEFFREREPKKHSQYVKYLTQQCGAQLNDRTRLADISHNPDYVAVRRLRNYGNALREYQWDLSLGGTWREGISIHTRQLCRVSSIDVRNWYVKLAATGFTMSTVAATWDDPTQSVICSAIAHRPIAMTKDQIENAKKSARAAVALASLGQPEKLREVLGGIHGATPRSFVIDWLAQNAWNPDMFAQAELANALQQDTDSTSESHLLKLYRAASDPGGLQNSPNN